MKTQTQSDRLAELDQKIEKARNTLEGMLPIYHQVDRKVKSLQLDIKCLQDQKDRILDGQLTLRFDLDF